MDKKMFGIEKLSSFQGWNFFRARSDDILTLVGLYFV